MDDYGRIYADWRISVLYSLYLRMGGPIVAKGAVLDSPAADGVASEPSANGSGASSLPNGFLRLSDLRKHPAKQTYNDLKEWIGKTIRLDGVNFVTGEKDGKTVITSGTMTFSEFDPTNPDREVSDDQTTTTAIPRGAIRALYEGASKHPDETIVCEVVQSKRGLALQ